MCSDTRITRGQHALAFLLSKQRLNTRSMLVCYTSTHVAATVAALNQAFGTRSVKRVGHALKAVHDQFGGFTELLAVVWSANSTPQVLELMPLDYQPRPRSGIVGIGDPAVLAWVMENFPTEAPEDPASQLPPGALDSLAQLVGHAVELPAPSFTIDDAAARVTAALSEGILQAGGTTVALPLQVMTVSNGLVRRLGVVSTADLTTFDELTADQKDLQFPSLQLLTIDHHQQRRSAIQVAP